MASLSIERVGEFDFTTIVDAGIFGLGVLLVAIGRAGRFSRLHGDNDAKEISGTQ